MTKIQINRRSFLKSAAAFASVSPLASFAAAQIASVPVRRSEELQSELISQWNADTEAVSHRVYLKYLRDGKTRGFRVLEDLEKAFEKVMREVKETVVSGDTPAIWSIYNMGYIVKTRKAVFSVDLNHRLGTKFVPLLDFALVTHNHGDHWRRDFFDAMTAQNKIVISNFLESPAFNAIKGDNPKGVGTYSIKDVKIRTSLIDHGNTPKMIDFTMAFEVKSGDWTLYHTGDSGKGTEPKLGTVWGAPDLWLFFPGCGIDTPKAVKKVRAKRIVFGHLWELGHAAGHKGRLDESLIRPRLAEAKKAGCKDVSLAFWGDRIT